MGRRSSSRRSLSVTLILILSLFLLSLFSPLVQANLNESTDGGKMFLSCIQDDECELRSVAGGEELVSDTVFASPAQPETVTIEFEMQPQQRELALLPTTLTSLVLDLRFTGDFSGYTKPELDVSLILGSSVTDWSFDADFVPSLSETSPYSLEDEPLNLNGERVLWPEDPVRLRMTFVLDRPGTWELYLRGSSSMELHIPWSEDINDRNSDEPSSDLEPRSTEFETVHYGALLENDRDCWSFSIEQNEVVNIYVQWETVPIELQQSHGLPDLIQPNGRLSSAPEVIVRDDDDSTRTTYRWRALPVGDYIFCFGGTAGKFQPYTWTGQLAFEGAGPVTPADFDGKAFYPAGSGIIGDESSPVSLSRYSSGFLFISLILFAGFVIDGLRHSTSSLLRFGAFTPGVLFLLVGGILHPMWALSDEVQVESEIQLDELIENRLQQLWDASYPGVPEKVLVTHTGATWGMLDGERLEMRLEVDQAIPLPDGRWQLIVPELQELRLDQAIFSQVSRGGAQTTDDGMLEQQTVRFILLAGRSLLLDLLMLEAMMIVDEKPTSSVFHVDFKMVDVPATGSVSVPAWGTRPVSVSEYDWLSLQSALFPERISVSLCDCDLDLLDVRFIASPGFDTNDVPPFISVENASGLVPYATPIGVLGLVLCAVSSRGEYTRRLKARNLASKLLTGNTQWD
ncbi:MAG: hypothetical protein L7U62_03575 [Candidatus Poseidoniaceae archaeon]|nr:hypothetical protein [Candidatus Poseidoniaceae archaeon]